MPNRDDRGRNRGRLELTARDLIKWALNYRGERQGIFRQYLFALSGRISPSIAVETKSMLYYVSTSDNEVGRRLFVSGGVDESKLALTARLIEEKTGRGLPGRHFVDIGANIGTAIIPAVTLLGATYGWAFEPSPANVKLLRCNLIANEIDDKVTVLPIALSDRSGVSALELSPDNWGDHRIVVSQDDGALNEAGRPHIEVKVARFDDVLRDHGIDLDLLGLVWIDAQGHEGRILAGAESLLQSEVPVLAEYWPYGLRRSSCLELFHSAVASHYSTIIDIGGAVPVEYPARSISELERKYGSSESFTDLLLL